jgi:hypothetical protein
MLKPSLVLHRAEQDVEYDRCSRRQKRPLRPGQRGCSPLFLRAVRADPMVDELPGEPHLPVTLVHVLPSLMSA